MLETCPHCQATNVDFSLPYCTSCGRLLQNGNNAPELPLLQVSEQTNNNVVPPNTLIQGLEGETQFAGPRLSIQENGGTADYRLGIKPLTLGRGQDQDIILKAPFVSDRHALITPVGDSYQIQDIGSVDGLLYRGKLLTPYTPHTLVDGDVLRIGDSMHGDFVTLTYHNEAAPTTQLLPRTPLRIEARGLTMSVPDPKRPIGNRIASLLRMAQPAQKSILRRVSLCIEPGEFVALVGGSGAGKSTLMRALSGFSRASDGTVQINGTDFYNEFDVYRSLLGYVPQDDIVHRMLPVTRALTYSAKLRLSQNLQPQAIGERITQVLEDVEMDEHRAKLVDDLSGGQRKRVSIAAELLADPSLFFLDEPTSGLDPGLEKKMMFTLRRLADEGRTVMLVTHATANITQCDLVAFMAAGRLVYYGPPQEALRFFGVTSHDFADIYTRLEGRFKPESPVFEHDLEMQQSYKEWREARHRGDEQPWLAELWEIRFLRSPYHQRYIQDRLSRPVPELVRTAPPSQVQQKVPAQERQQFLLLTRRYIELILQDRNNLLILLLQAPIIAALLALVSDANAITGSGANFPSARTVMFMLAIISVWFGIINSVREITKETAIYQRERLANLSIGAYVASKVSVLSILVLIQSFLLLAIIQLKVKMPAEGLLLPINLELYVTTVLSSLGGLALGLLISTVSATPDRAISVVPLALIPQIIFSGVIFSLSGAAVALSWFAVTHWSMEAYGSIVDLNRLASFGIAADDGYTHDPWHLIGRWLLIIIHIVVCLALTTWLLQRKDVRKAA